jgi:hypothetical protein
MDGEDYIGGPDMKKASAKTREKQLRNQQGSERERERERKRRGRCC